MPASPQFLFIAEASLGTCAQPPRVPQNKKITAASISVILGVYLTTFNIVDKSGAAVFYLVKNSYWDPQTSDAEYRNFSGPGTPLAAHGWGALREIHKVS